MYAALGFGQALGVLFGSFAIAIGAIIASRRLHDKLVNNVMRSPMSFFDTTPMGRVLNRFSKDIYVVDETIPRSFRSFISTFLSVVSTIIVIVVATPYFLAIIVPLLIVYFIIQRIYVNASRQLKRLESVSRSPIYSHFQETLGGVTTIRAYHKQEEFLEQSEHKVDYNQEAYYPGICANRWLAIRLEFIGNLVVFFAALFAVLAVVFPDASRTITPGLAGLSVSYALQVTKTPLHESTVHAYNRLSLPGNPLYAHTCTHCMKYIHTYVQDIGIPLYCCTVDADFSVGLKFC